MSVRLRIVFMTTSLIAILFSIGGAVMIHTSFTASLEKEEQMAVDSNELILRIVQYVGEDGEWFSEEQLISVIENVCSQDSIDCLLVTCTEKEIYKYQKKENIVKEMNPVTNVEENQVFVTCFFTEEGSPYLQTTTQLTLNRKSYHLSMGRNLTYIYEVRTEQVAIFQKTFLLMFLLGSVLSWGMATFITRHLRKLTKASKEIGEGNLSYRSNIKSEDEIGTLSKAFDCMAETLEQNIFLLKESAEQKEQFMGAFTHELKTPMTSIIGYADLLRTQRLNEEDKADALEYIFSEAKRLENMSLKMLDLFVADKKQLVCKECSPAELTQYVVKHLQNTYAKSQVQIEVNVQEGTCRLESDLFQTLLINLLDNAKKAMEQGGTIFVSVQLMETGCIVRVQDNGKGIPKEAIRHLTEAFFRVDKARAGSKGSAGIGLALCEKIVQLHNGSMTFESEEHVGTIVTVILNPEESHSWNNTDVKKI
uniref:sensor histidine kinase n=1 Tax=Agathobacter sp. TaxID=2021311 RepID=UPI0040563F66